MSLRHRHPKAGFQSTCPARGTTPVSGQASRCSANFNPRAPRGARPTAITMTRGDFLFQSTCPARGTTGRGFIVMGRGKNFNPRAPRGARHPTVRPLPWRCLISIHVPREGHDCGNLTNSGKSTSNFNPRAPRGARRALARGAS